MTGVQTCALPISFLAKEMSGRKLRTVTTLHGTDIMLVGQDASFANKVHLALQSKGFLDKGDNGAANGD